MRHGRMFGHRRQCYQSDDRCHGDEEAWFQQPPDQEYQAAVQGSMSASGDAKSHYFGHEAQCYRWDKKCHCTSAQPYQLPPEEKWKSEQPSEPPLTVKLTPEQIIRHYSSLKGSVQPHATTAMQRHATPAMQRLTDTHITSEMSYNDSCSPWPCSGDNSGGWAAGGQGSVPTLTNPPWPRQSRDLPPSYESLFPSFPVSEGQRQPGYGKHT